VVLATLTSLGSRRFESRRFALSVNSMYQQLLAQANNCSSPISEEEREHIQHYVSRAKMFIANINQRRQTMQKITDTNPRTLYGL